MDKDCSVIHSEGRAEMINLMQVKVCSGRKEKCTIKNDTQTLNLWGRTNFIMINIHRETIRFSSISCAYKEDLGLITIVFQKVI